MSTERAQQRQIIETLEDIYYITDDEAVSLKVQQALAMIRTGLVVTDWEKIKETIQRTTGGLLLYRNGETGDFLERREWELFFNKGEDKELADLKKIIKEALQDEEPTRVCVWPLEGWAPNSKIIVSVSTVKKYEEDK